jgi:hypothetical protein
VNSVLLPQAFLVCLSRNKKYTVFQNDFAKEMNELGVCYDAFCNSGLKIVYLMDLTGPDFLLACKVSVQNLCRRSAHQ